MFAWFSAASVCASRANRATRSASAANIREDLESDVAIEPRVAPFIDLAHSAGAMASMIS